MQFGNPNYWILLTIPLGILISLFRARARRKRLRAFADSAILLEIFPTISQERSNTILGILFSATILVLLALAALRPQYGFVWKEQRSRGVDIVIAVDVSDSMLAEDVSPNRLEVAKRKILDLLGHLRGDRIALVAFAGAAFIETPLTLDYATFRSFLSTVDTELIPVKGTDLEGAILKSIDAFGSAISDKGHQKAKSMSDRALLLITDGEDLVGNFSRAYELAKANNIKIFIIGIGTPAGAPIPISSGYKKDKTGQVVITKLNEQALLSLALSTGGLYVKSIGTNQDTLSVYELGIKKSLTDDVTEGGRIKSWNEYYQLPLSLALLLLIFARLRQINLLKSIFTIRFIIAIAFFLSIASKRALAESTESVGARAKRDYEEGKFDNALEKFQQGQEHSSTDFRFGLGKGASAYRLGRFEDAYANFLESLKHTPDDAWKAKLLYNTANSLVQLGKFKEAIEHYNESLKLAPKDQETLDNLAYAKKLLEQQQSQDKQKDDKQQQQDNNQQSNEQSNNDQQNADSESSKQQNDSESKSSKKDERTSSDSQPDKQQPNSDEQQQQSTEQDNDPSKQPSSADGKQQEKDQPNAEQSPSKAEGGSNSDDQQESLLYNIQESRRPLREFRKEQLRQELNARGQTPPEKDW